MKGDGGPPARGMSRSDKGSADSGEDGKVTSGQEGLQPVAVRDDNFSGPSGRGESQRPGLLVTFGLKSNASAA